MVALEKEGPYPEHMSHTLMTQLVAMSHKRNTILAAVEPGDR